MPTQRVQRTTKTIRRAPLKPTISSLSIVILVVCTAVCVSVIAMPSSILGLLFGGRQEQINKNALKATPPSPHAEPLAKPIAANTAKPWNGAEAESKLESSFAAREEAALLFKSVPASTAKFEVTGGNFSIETSVKNNPTVDVSYAIPQSGSKEYPFWVIYCTFPTEYGFTKSELFSRIPTELGLPIFGMIFKDMTAEKVDYSDPKSCYYFKESGSYDAVMAARKKMAEVLGVADPRPILLVGISGGGSWAMQLGAANPDVFLGTVTAASASVPDSSPWKKNFSALAISTFGDNEDVTQRNNQYVQNLQQAQVRAQRVIAPPGWAQRGREKSYFCHGPSAKANALMMAWIQDFRAAYGTKAGKGLESAWMSDKLGELSVTFPGQNSLNAYLNLPIAPVFIEQEACDVYFSVGVPVSDRNDFFISLSPLGGIDSYNAKFNSDQLGDLGFSNVLFADKIGGIIGSQNTMAFLEKALAIASVHRLRPTIVCWGELNRLFNREELAKFTQKTKETNVVSVTTTSPAKAVDGGQITRFDRTIFIKDKSAIFAPMKGVTVIDRKDANEMTLQSWIVSELANF